MSSNPILKLDHVYKRFGAHLAVNDLSFELSAGEIVGLLGPNGAGKTTTMRLIASYFFPDVGHISIDDQDTARQTLLTQSEIGYLPENNPLYSDMLVVDFLLMTWGLTAKNTSKPSSAEKLKHIYELAKSVNLEQKLLLPISELSKGYKQRVGIASALIADPKVLILDEPTEGLDPNERQEIRHLIKKLAQNRVILISTHVLQEVKALCTKAIVINDGQLIAAGDPNHLTNQFIVTVEIEGPKIESELRQLINNSHSVETKKSKVPKKSQTKNTASQKSPKKSQSKIKDHFEIVDKKAQVKKVIITTSREIRPELNQLAAKNNWKIWSISTADALDQVFQNLK